MQKAQALSVSIVIPVFNEENYIKDCLDLIAKQTVMPQEVIVVDNNCSDKTISIAKTYPFVRVIKEPKQGVLFARNTGFNAVTTDIIGRIDADTHLPNYWVERVVESFSNNDIDAVNGPVRYYDMPIVKFGLWLDRKIRRSVAESSDVFPFLFGTNMALRNNAWRAVRSSTCDKRAMYEDIDLAIHLYKKKFHIFYWDKLDAGMSARRFDDHIWDFYRYIKLYRKTYDMHHMKARSAQLAIVIYMIAFVLCQPLRWVYDPITKKRTVKNLFHRALIRKDPMASSDR